MSISDAFSKGQIIILKRNKMNNLMEQLVHTTKKDELLYLSIMLESQPADITLDLGYRSDALVFDCYNFFNDVGMLG